MPCEPSTRSRIPFLILVDALPVPGLVNATIVLRPR